MPLFFSRVASATRCPHIDMADSTVDAVGRRPRNLGSSAWTPTSPQRSCPLCGHRNGAGWGLHCPSRTYFSLTRLRPDLRGLQENAVLAGEVRLRAGTTYCAVGRSPASCHNQGAAAPRGDIRRIRGSFCSVASRLSDNQALLGARLPATGAAPPWRHRHQGCPWLECGDGAAWSSRSCRICRSDRRRAAAHLATPEQTLAEGARVQRNKGCP